AGLGLLGVAGGVEAGEDDALQAQLPVLDLGDVLELGGQAGHSAQRLPVGEIVLLAVGLGAVGVRGQRGVAAGEDPLGDRVARGAATAAGPSALVPSTAVSEAGSRRKAMGTIGALLGSVSVRPPRPHGAASRSRDFAQGAVQGGARGDACVRILLGWTSTTSPPPPRPTTAGSRCRCVLPGVTSTSSPAHRCSAGAAWTRPPRCCWTGSTRSPRRRPQRGSWTSAAAGGRSP